jgi:hypothetical protein
MFQHALVRKYKSVMASQFKEYLVRFFVLAHDATFYNCHFH